MGFIKIIVSISNAIRFNHFLIYIVTKNKKKTKQKQKFNEHLNSRSICFKYSELKRVI